MFRTIGNELKNQPLGSLGAIAGIASLFFTINAFPISLEGNLLESYNARLIFGFLLSISAAYGFLFIAYLLLRSKYLAAELGSFIFVFIAALSTKLAFTEVFLKTAQTELDSDVYSNTQEGMAVFAIFFGSVISVVLFNPWMKKYFLKDKAPGSIDDDRDTAYLVLVPVILIIWISAFYFPMGLEKTQ